MYIWCFCLFWQEAFWHFDKRWLMLIISVNISHQSNLRCFLRCSCPFRSLLFSCPRQFMGRHNWKLLRSARLSVTHKGWEMTEIKSVFKLYHKFTCILNIFCIVLIALHFFRIWQTLKIVTIRLASVSSVSWSHAGWGSHSKILIKILTSACMCSKKKKSSQ